MKNWPDIHAAQAERERRLLLAEHASFEKFSELAKGKLIPAGSVWHWSTGCVWGPIGSAERKQQNAA